MNDSTSCSGCDDAPPRDSENSSIRWIDPETEGYRPGLSDEELERLAKDTGLSVATLRNAGSFYAENKWRSEDGCVVQVCDGTSCRLGGGKAVEQLIRRYGHECRKVYCLGFCDRSPVSMIPFDQMCEHTPTSIRNMSPQAIATRRILKGSFSAIEKAVSEGVYAGLVQGLGHPPAQLIAEVEKSRERMWSALGSSTGQKLRVAAGSKSDRKYVIANGDEGNPGSFLDRVLMEQDPHTILEGMILCGYAIGASEGIIYIRSEYPRAVEIMHSAIEEARRERYLGKEIRGSGFSFDVRIFIGEGSYGRRDEAALIASLEGLYGETIPGQSNPDEVGLHGMPTVVNNIETLSKIPFIMLEGGNAYCKYGTDATPGTKVICLNHGFENPGLVEIEFGITFREVVEDIGGGGRDGEPLAAVLVGGPMGSLLQPHDWDYPICYETLNRHGIDLGHGGFIAVPESADFRDLVIHLAEFMIRESCGQCAPCLRGSRAFLTALNENRPVSALVAILDDIESSPSCRVGQFVPGPLRTLLSDFPGRVFGGKHEFASL